MERSRRVAVTSPQTRLAHARGRARGRWRVARLDAGDAERAEVHYRRQRTQAGLALLGVALVVPGLPLLLWARPDLDAVALFGIPVSWLALGVLPYPAMAAIGFWQLYRSEHIERAPTAPGPADAPDPGAPHAAQHRLRIAVRVRRRPAAAAPHAPSPAPPAGGARGPGPGAGADTGARAPEEGRSAGGAGPHPESGGSAPSARGEHPGPGGAAPPEAEQPGDGPHAGPRRGSSAGGAGPPGSDRDPGGAPGREDR